MNANALIDRLTVLPAAVPSMLAALRDPEIRWKPQNGAWSILEIVAHLADEEVDDFRMRLRLTLESPTRDWPPIDPEGWAVTRRYNDLDPAQVLDRFIRERKASLTWLRGLSDVDWNQAHTHPKFGSMRAGELLVAWVAHDALHLRQIAKRLYELTAVDAPEFSPAYAGEWKA